MARPYRSREMVTQRIVVVEDEEDIRDILAYTLEREGYVVHVAPNGVRGLSEVRKRQPDLVLLDLMLPGVDGLEICRALKQDEDTRNIAIIMVTAKSEESDVVLGLGLGADDYILKPFSPKEVVARVRAVLRRTANERSEENGDKVVVRGELRIDPQRFRVADGELEIAFTATEFKLLHHLALHPGRVFTRGQLLEIARGDDAAAFERSVDAHIRTVRKKLGDKRDLIETVRSIGYRFAETAASA